MATTSKKSLAPTVVKPYDEENKWLSKADYLKKQRKIKEDNAKLKAYSAELKKGKPTPQDVVDKSPDKKKGKK